MKRFKDVSEALNGFPLDRVIVVDTETTGLDPYGGDEILSIGICDGFGNRLLDTLVCPTGKRRWNEAQRINGISPKMVASEPTIGTLRNQIRDLIYSDNLIVGYNVLFDLGFIAKGCGFDDLPLHHFDVMSEYARVHGEELRQGGRKYLKLVECAESYGYSYTAHASINDAEATAYCYRALLADESYLDERIPEVVSGLQHVRLEQRKTTIQEVLNLVGNGVQESNGLLKVGAVTTGKNKGKQRYEAYVNERCVGVTSPHEVSKIRSLYLLDDGEPVPESIRCTLSLTAFGTSASCSARITDDGEFADAVRSRAAEDREYLGSYAKEGTATAETKSPAGGRADNTVKEKRRLFLVCLFTGFLGTHRFMMRKYVSGLIYLFTCGLFFVGWIVDTVNLGRSWMKSRRPNDGREAGGQREKQQAPPHRSQGATKTQMAQERGKLVCPSCGSTRVEVIDGGGKKLSLGKAAVGGLLMGPVGAVAGGVGLGKKGKATLHCLDCGKLWKRRF